MKTIQYVCFGLLNISFCFGHIFAQKPPTPCYIDVEGNKKSFFFKEEVSIVDYYDVLGFIKQEYGEDSEQYKFLLPDTVKYRELYGFLFFYLVKGTGYEAADSIRRLHQTRPMVGISYEQSKAYCQWMEYMVNYGDSIRNKSCTKSYIWRCSLPEKADYEMAFESKKAKITQKESLSPLQNRYRCRRGINYTICLLKRGRKYIFGLTDNVAEYTQDGMVVEGGENTALKFVDAKDCKNLIGFRIKLTAVSKK